MTTEDRRNIPREADWTHRARLMCKRGPDGKCTEPLCKRAIGKSDKEIDGKKAISPEKVEG